eukprot:scaffold7312_cov64-Phaeocystis_antarctica.AAC.2
MVGSVARRKKRVVRENCNPPRLQRAVCCRSVFPRGWHRANVGKAINNNTVGRSLREWVAITYSPIQDAPRSSTRVLRTSALVTAFRLRLLRSCVGQHLSTHVAYRLPPARAIGGLCSPVAP